MAFWKIYKVKDNQFNVDKNQKEIAMVNGQREIYKFLMSLPDVGSVRDNKSWGYTSWWTFSKTTHRALDKYIAVQYSPSEKELAIIRPKKKYQPLPNRKIGIKKGDVYYTSWGYDQTNIDWIMVVDVSPTGKTVKARRCRATVVGNQGSHDVVAPVREPYGDVFQMKVEEYNNNGVTNYTLIGTYADSRGEKGFRKGYFSQYHQGDTVTETNSYFGH